MPETLVVPLGDEDRFWDPNAIPETRSPRFMSSGVAGSPPRDDRPAIAAHGSETGPGALASEDTASRVTMDNAGFEAATRTGGPFGEGFRLGVISSQTDPASLPPAEEVDGTAYVYLDVIHRTLGGAGEISASVNGGRFLEPGEWSYFGGDAAMSAAWTRDLVYQTELFLPFAAAGWNRLRDSLAAGEVHGHVRSFDLLTYEVAYVALVVSYEPLDLAPPPRRVYPRDDGLAMSAPRAYPPSRAVQSSARVGGGGYV